MEKLLKSLGIDETASAEEIVGKLEQKQSEIMERLDNVEDETRRQKLEENLKEIEAAITAFSWMRGKEQTGIVREEDVTSEDFSDLKGQSIEDEKEVEKLYNEALALLETPHYTTGIRIMQHLAEHGCGYGYLPAIYQMGKIYSSEKYGMENRNESKRWFGIAADRGHANAQTHMGSFALIRQDYQNALKWYQSAVRQGDAVAYYQMGQMYENGQGVDQDPAKAAEWYQGAAEKGDAEAQYKLGNAYVDGQGVDRDPAKAAEWYQKAAEQGNRDAQFELGCMYENGYGVPKDYEKAVEWYRKAANQGHMRAKDYWANQGKSREWYNNKMDAISYENYIKNYEIKRKKRKKILWGIIFVILFILFYRYIH